MADAAEELQRMCRDIRALKPDIVITMSGVNDQLRKDNKFNRWHPEEPFSLWCRMESYIRTIAGSEGAECFVFLQPINTGMPDADLREQVMFVQDTITLGGGFSERARDDDHYIDLLKLFRHREGKFVDCCHYSDEANEEIAQIVFETIKDSL